MKKIISIIFTVVFAVVLMGCPNLYDEPNIPTPCEDDSQNTNGNGTNSGNTEVIDNTLEFMPDESGLIVNLGNTPLETITTYNLVFLYGDKKYTDYNVELNGNVYIFSKKDVLQSDNVANTIPIVKNENVFSLTKGTTLHDYYFNSVKVDNKIITFEIIWK